MFGGGLTVIVRRTEGAVGHAPPRREDDEVGNGHAGPRRLGGQHREDGGILQEGQPRVRRRNSANNGFVKGTFEEALTA